MTIERMAEFDAQAAEMLRAVAPLLEGTSAVEPRVRDAALAIRRHAKGLRCALAVLRQEQHNGRMPART